MRRLAAIGSLLAAGTLAPSSSWGYTISSLVSTGCHEKVTTDALRAVRTTLAPAAALPASSQEQALVGDLEFSPADDMTDLGGASLLVGARDNDLKGRSSSDLTELAFVHGDPNNQDEHCLRAAADDEPNGSAQAIDACRAFIHQRAMEAIAGLSPQGLPDPSARTSLKLHLSLRGDIDADLPTYYVRIGQAMHALQDSFTHLYRTQDGRRPTVVLNWLDSIAGTLNEPVDGPAHASALDDCNDGNDLLTLRRMLATEASIALLRATLDPTLSAPQKMVAVDGVLDTYLSYEPGCTFDNGWCAAPETKFADSNSSTFGCAAALDPKRSNVQGPALLALVLAAATWLKRSGASLRRGRNLLAMGALFCSYALAAGEASAEEPSPESTPTELALPPEAIRPSTAPTESTPPSSESAPPLSDAEPRSAEPMNHSGVKYKAVLVPPGVPAPSSKPVPEPGPRDPSRGAWGAYLGFSGSIDKPAVAGSLGIRRRLSTHWTVGVDGEWNPWISVNGKKELRAGVFNGYATAILRFPLAYEKINLRTTLHVGVSYLLIELYGAKEGTVGLYGGISPIGLEWKVSRSFYLVVDPLNVAVPIPQLEGVPLYYPQYRFSLGIEIMGG